MIFCTERLLSSCFTSRPELRQSKSGRGNLYRRDAILSDTGSWRPGWCRRALPWRQKESRRSALPSQSCSVDRISGSGPIAAGGSWGIGGGDSANSGGGGAVGGASDTVGGAEIDTTRGTEADRGAMEAATARDGEAGGTIARDGDVGSAGVGNVIDAGIGGVGNSEGSRGATAGGGVGAIDMGAAPAAPADAGVGRALSAANARVVSDARGSIGAAFRWIIVSAKWHQGGGGFVPHHPEAPRRQGGASAGWQACRAESSSRSYDAGHRASWT